jgi:adenosylhomocysteinase
MAVEKQEQRRNIMGYHMKDGRWINILAEGRLVNLAAGDGHPAEIMDMSFALQALCAEFMVKNHKQLGKSVIDVPGEIDNRVAEMKLKAWNIEIDKMTADQKKYLESWAE